MATILPIDFGRYRRVVILTGAGISVASGLRPFRGPGGLWNEPGAAAWSEVGRMADDPAGAWRFFAAMRAASLAAVPNEGHRAITRLQSRLAERASVTVVTQNIDGLHQRAGTDGVIEVHGAARRTRCTDEACTGRPFDDDRTGDEAPRCPACGALQRPDVVLFGEALPVDAEWAVKKALRGCDLFVAVGTSGTVSPASNYVRSARYEGADTVLVNLEPMSPPNPAFLREELGRAEEILPRLFGE